jgi:peroxiredoxin
MSPAIPRASTALLLGVLLALLACPGRAPSGRSELVGQEAPPFRLSSVAGGEISLSDYPGRVVLLEFWATWCNPCHEQARILAPLYQAMRGRPVEFLAVDSGEESAVVERFVAKNPFAYPVLLDPEDSLALALSVVALPTLVIVDREGRISWINEGIADAETLRRELERAGA